MDILPTRLRSTEPNPKPRRPGPAMDEQAGPGVFFNNSNNSGAGNIIKALQTSDVGGGEAARAQYNIPGILHFLQHEWGRYEVERSHWDVERAELQVSSLKSLRCQLSDIVFVCNLCFALNGENIAQNRIEECDNSMCNCVSANKYSLESNKYNLV